MAMLLIVGVLQSDSLANPLKPADEEQFAQPRRLAMDCRKRVGSRAKLSRCRCRGSGAARTTGGRC
jgi:hypothetical protein